MWSFDAKTDRSIHAFHFAAQISVSGTFLEFRPVSLRYKTPDRLRTGLLVWDSSSSKNSRKKRKICWNIHKNMQKPWTSKTVATPSDNEQNPSVNFSSNEQKSTAQAKKRVSLAAALVEIALCFGQGNSPRRTSYPSLSSAKTSSAQGISWRREIGHLRSTHGNPSECLTPSENAHHDFMTAKNAGFACAGRFGDLGSAQSVTTWLDLKFGTWWLSMG